MAELQTLELQPVPGSQMVGKTRKKKAREKLAGQEKGREREPPPPPALPSFLPFHFRVCAFSIQRTRLSRSLEQATRTPDKNARFFKHQVRCMKSSAKWQKSVIKRQTRFQLRLLCSVLPPLSVVAYLPNMQPVPGSQIVQCGRIKTSKAKIRRARLGKGDGGAQPPRVLRISFD